MPAQMGRCIQHTTRHALSTAVDGISICVDSRTVKNGEAMRWHQHPGRGYLCGTGGLMHGVRLAGIDIKAKFDNGTVGVTKSGSKQTVEV